MNDIVLFIIQGITNKGLFICDRSFDDGTRYRAMSFQFFLRPMQECNNGFSFDERPRNVGLVQTVAFEKRMIA